jgi:hypothetical protein
MASRRWILDLAPFLLASMYAHHLLTSTPQLGKTVLDGYSVKMRETIR